VLESGASDQRKLSSLVGKDWAHIEPDLPLDAP
jgi:hypothetical protein